MIDRRKAAIFLLAVVAGACLHKPAANRNVIVTSGPNNLDPRIGTDDVSQKAGQLIFDSLMTLDDRLRVVPALAERLDHPSPTTYVAALRRVFDSRQTPPTGFNRGYFQDARVDGLIDQATASTDDDRRRALYGEVQKIVAGEAPYISLWYKTNVAVAQRTLTGIHLLPTAEFTFLKDVARTAPSRPAAN